MFDCLCSYITQIFIGLSGLITLLLLCYYLILFTRFLSYKAPKWENNRNPVSIIVAANNDAHFLATSLPKLLKQNYTEYEVVVINYCSNDDTTLLLNDLEKQYPHLKTILLNSPVTNIKGKKFPISIGIKESKYDVLLFISPECHPASNQWLANMAKHFTHKKNIVLGYSTLAQQKSFFSRLLHFDQLQSALFRFSLAIVKKPVLADGNNLAYSKTLFAEQRGFAIHNHIAAGEDDIFINQTMQKHGKSIHYAIETEPESFTVSMLKLTFKRWWHIKRQKQYTQKFYEKSHRFILQACQTISTFFYILLGITFYLSAPNLLWTLVTAAIFLVKTVTQYIIYGMATYRLHEKQILPLLLIWDIVLSILYPFLALSAKKQ